MTPASLEDLLVRDEGEVLHAYPDSLGYTSIGVGRMIDARKGGGISQAESRYLLANDIARVTDELHSLFPWSQSLDPVRHAVMVSMLFNVASFPKWTHTLTAVEDGEYAVAAQHMLASEPWHTQVGNRADRLAQMMATGDWV